MQRQETRPQDRPVGKQIPVVTIGEESRGDSTPIGLWLDERFPDHPRLLPKDPQERASWLLALPNAHHRVPGRVFHCGLSRRKART